jgi:threonine/homoserine/homoserine lactone efflux protein
MLTGLLLKGMLVGFLIAAPVGPINVLCVRRTLVHGRWAGLASGIGAAVADTIYGAIAVLGLSLITGVMLAERFWIGIAGAALLAVLGVRTLLAGPPHMAPAKDPTSLLGDLTSTFVLTLTNPITVISFLGIFAAFGIEGDDTFAVDDGMLLLGVFLGSLVWWVTLTGLVGVFHGRFSNAGLLWANRAAGIIILLFAAGVLWDIAVRAV